MMNAGWSSMCRPGMGFLTAQPLAISTRHTQDRKQTGQKTCRRRTQPATMGRKGRKRVKNARIVPTRPLPKVPPLPDPDKCTRLQPAVKRRSTHAAATQIRETLHARRDVLIVGQGICSKICALIGGRERSEHALVLVATREDAMRASGEIGIDARGARVIVAAGNGYGSWRHAAMNANASKRSVIVVGTARGVVKGFVQNGHGKPWLGKVGFLGVVDVEGMMEVGCMDEMKRVLRAVRVRERRKNAVVALKEPVGEVKRFVEAIVRPGWERVVWEGESEGENDKEGVRLNGRQVVRVCEAGMIIGELRREMDAILNGEGVCKMIVVCGTGRVTEVYASVFRGMGYELWDLHGRTSVASRERRLEEFYRADKAILFASDGVTRGGRVQSVKCVVQVGMNESREQYVRRAALVAEGEGNKSVLLVTREEAEYAIGVVEEGGEIKLEGEVAIGEQGEQGEQGRALDAVDEKARRVAYQSWISYYSGRRRRLGWSMQQVVQRANEWAMATFGSVPAVDDKLAGKLNLLRLDGVSFTKVPRQVNLVTSRKR